jgi:hypothetical protein
MECDLNIQGDPLSSGPTSSVIQSTIYIPMVMWCGVPISGSGPVFIEYTVNTEVYLQFSMQM